jgi:hypothetical protein
MLFRSTVLAVAASFITIASADYYVEPNSVPLSERQAWCQQEKQTCPIICQQVADGTTKVNDCNPKTLTYGCICGNGLQPNVSEYSLTLPYFVCTEWGNQCVKSCKSNMECASSCRQDNPCGAQNPERSNATETASTSGVTKPSASATDDGTTIYTDVSSSSSSGKGKSSSSDDSSSSSSSTDKKNSSAALEAGRQWGLVVVLGSMFVGFAML